MDPTKIGQSTGPLQRIGPAVLAGLLAVSGCYTFTPLERGAVEPGTEVRVTLSPSGVDLVSQITGREARAVEGVLMAWEDEQALLAMLLPQAQARSADALPRQTVPIPARDVLLVERKDFDRGRTALAVAAVGTVTGLIIWRAAGGGGGGPDGQDNGGTTFTRIPLRSP